MRAGKQGVWLLLAVALGGAVSGVPARAGVVYVNAGVSGGATNGTSWADAFSTLGEALAVSTNGDAIWVAQGTYRPAPPGAAATNAFLIRTGVALYGGFVSGMGDAALRNPFKYRCILSGDLNGDDIPGFGNRGDNVNKVIHVNGAAGLILDGFTIRGGQNNVAGIPGDGAGLQILNTWPFLVSRCVFTENYNAGASSMGGGMACGLGATGTVRQCLIYGNYSSFRGGGFGIDGFVAPYASVAIVNCTVTENSAVTEGDGVYARADSQSVLTIKNSIIWNNNPTKSNTNDIQNIRERGNTTVPIAYSDYDRVRCSGDGILDNGGHLTVDPLFANPLTGDFHLKSQFGRTLPSGGIVYDAETSPCVDAGDPADPCIDEPQAEPCRVDMGAYGGTREASGNEAGTPTAMRLIVK